MNNVGGSNCMHITYLKYILHIPFRIYVNVPSDPCTIAIHIQIVAIGAHDWL